MNNAYEEYVLSVGDFDERIFLDDDAEEEIGTPAKSREDVTGELKERMQQRTSLQQHVDQVSVHFICDLSFVKVRLWLGCLSLN